MRGLSPEIAARLGAIPEARTWRDAPLGPFTTMGVGGKADILLTVASPAALAEALRVVVDAGVPWSILGGGSNLLVADSGFAGVIVKLDEAFHYVEAPVGAGGRTVRVEAGGGLPLSRLAVHVAQAGLSGLEFACGIPGSVGGAVVMNAGAHSGSVSGVLEAVHVVGPADSGWLQADVLDWGYRRSGLPGDMVVTAARFRLSSAVSAEVLEHHRTLLGVRRRTQPRAMRTFGSTFRNPPGDYAGRLLESSGLKGVRRGGAQVSTVHANFISNVGDATAGDVFGLMSMMRGTVRARHAVVLEPEVRVLGGSFPWDQTAAGAG